MVPLQPQSIVLSLLPGMLNSDGSIEPIVGSWKYILSALSLDTGSDIVPFKVILNGLTNLGPVPWNQRGKWEARYICATRPPTDLIHHAEVQPSYSVILTNWVHLSGRGLTSTGTVPRPPARGRDHLEKVSK